VNWGSVGRRVLSDANSRAAIVKSVHILVAYSGAHDLLEIAEESATAILAPCLVGQSRILVARRAEVPHLLTIVKFDPGRGYSLLGPTYGTGGLLQLVQHGFKSLRRGTRPN
jgi:hypothetical protein